MGTVFMLVQMDRSFLCSNVVTKHAPGFQDDDSDDQGEAAADGSQMTPEGTGGGLLTVTIVQAEGLEGKHHNNPFVELHFKGDKRKTHVSSMPWVPSTGN